MQEDQDMMVTKVPQVHKDQVDLDPLENLVVMDQREAMDHQEGALEVSREKLACPGYQVCLYFV